MERVFCYLSRGGARVKRCCKYGEAKGGRIVARRGPGRPGSAPDRGTAELIIKTFSETDLMFKGAAPGKKKGGDTACGDTT